MKKRHFCLLSEIWHQMIWIWVKCLYCKIQIPRQFSTNVPWVTLYKVCLSRFDMLKNMAARRHPKRGKITKLNGSFSIQTFVWFQDTFVICSSHIDWFEKIAAMRCTSILIKWTFSFKQIFSQTIGLISIKLHGNVT